MNTRPEIVEGAMTPENIAAALEKAKDPLQITVEVVGNDAQSAEDTNEPVITDEQTEDLQNQMAEAEAEEIPDHLRITPDAFVENEIIHLKGHTFKLIGIQPNYLIFGFESKRGPKLTRKGKTKQRKLQARNKKQAEQARQEKLNESAAQPAESQSEA